MKAREAEKLIADILTKSEDKLESGKNVSTHDLIGLQRSQPIYEKKLHFAAKQKKNFSNRWKTFARKICRKIGFKISLC
jgi:hypothetical protein